MFYKFFLNISNNYIKKERKKEFNLLHISYHLIIESSYTIISIHKSYISKFLKWKSRIHIHMYILTIEQNIDNSWTLPLSSFFKTISLTFLFVLSFNPLTLPSTYPFIFTSLVVFIFPSQRGMHLPIRLYFSICPAIYLLPVRSRRPLSSLRVPNRHVFPIPRPTIDWSAEERRTKRRSGKDSIQGLHGRKKREPELKKWSRPPRLLFRQL